MAFDFLDIWAREMDPARANLKLDDWRDLYEIISNPVKRSDLAALVIARLREIGQASSLFGVAASVGTVLGYRTRRNWSCWNTRQAWPVRRSATFFQF